MEINITWNICRVCLLEESRDLPKTSGGQLLINIFNEDKHLAKEIYECSGVVMKRNDNLPEKICKKCFLMAKHAANFRKSCRNSDAYLKSILQRTKSASNLFKPEIHSPLNISEDNLFGEERKETKHKENEVVSIKLNEEEYPLRTLKRKESQSIQEEESSKKHKLEIEIDIKNAEDLIAHDEEGEITENDLSNMVEMEEILDNAEQIDDSKVSTEEVNEISGIHDFEVENTFSKLSSEETTDNSDENEETNEKHNFSHGSDELYYLLKSIKDENETEEKETQKILQVDVSEESQEPEDNVEFMPEEEDEQQQTHMESEVEDCQPQVSSTVETKEEFIELQDQNSNISDETNGLATEYIVDEYLIDDTDNNPKARNSNVVVINKKLSSSMPPTDIKHTQVILPNRKTRSETATSSTSINSKNVPKIYVCDICGNHFGNRQLMNSHMKVHRQEKNHECELCLKRFITACNLQAHMRIHTGEKPFECQYCGRRFNDRSSHLRHERIHTNEKPYQCNDCGKSFSLATTLKKHMKIHTGERLYRCEPCAKSFKLSHQLKAHITTSLHKGVIQLSQINN